MELALPSPGGAVPWGSDIQVRWGALGPSAEHVCDPQEAQFSGPCHLPLACQDLEVGLLDGRGLYPDRETGNQWGRKAEGGGCGWGWQDPKATGEGIWDRMGGVRKTGCSMTERAGLADVLHVLAESRRGQKVEPGTAKVGGRGGVWMWGQLPSPQRWLWAGPCALGCGLLALCQERLVVGSGGEFHPFVTRGPAAEPPP